MRAAINLAVVWLRSNYGWLLILCCLPLFATFTRFEIAIGIMAAIGLVRSIREPALLRDPSLRLLRVLFLCLWVPMLLSLPDAVNFGRGVGTALGYLRFPLAGVFIVLELRSATARARLLAGVFIVVTSWCVDAMVQFAWGTDLFGYPNDRLQLTGMFYPKATLGLVTATLLPVYYEAIRRYSARRPWVVIAVIPALAAVLLSSNRTAWFMLVIGSIAYLAYLARNASGVIWTRLAGLSLASLAVLGALATQYPPLRNTVATTGGLFSGEYQAIDKATSYRLSLWTTAGNMFEKHWLNGIGVRGYRYVYTEYAAPDDFWLQDGRVGQTHPHQFVLEIAAETGSVGIAGYLLFWCVLIKDLRRPAFPPRELPWLLAVMVALCPLNVHMAFYGAYWSAISWWLLLVGVGMSSPSRSAAPHGSRQ